MKKSHWEKFDACGSSLAIHGEAILDAKVLYGSFQPSVYLELKPTVTVYAALNLGVPVTYATKKMSVKLCQVILCK